MDEELEKRLLRLERHIAALDRILLELVQMLETGDVSNLPKCKSWLEQLLANSDRLLNQNKNG